MEKHYYLYETSNLTNGKKYIGQHCTRNLDDGYYGSSKDLKVDVEVHKHSFKVIILKRCKNIFELGDIECEEIKKRNALKDPTYYNISNWRFYNKCFEYGLTKEHREKLIGKKRTPEQKKRYSLSKLGAKNPQYGKHGYWKGKKRPPLSEEHIRALHPEGKVYDTCSGKRWINNGEERQMVDQIYVDIFIKDGWKLGYKLKEESVKCKIVECPHCGKKGGGPIMYRFHFDNCKHKKKQLL